MKELKESWYVLVAAVLIITLAVLAAYHDDCAAKGGIYIRDAFDIPRCVIVERP